MMPMNMMNNPVFGLIQAMQNGKNPMAILQIMSRNNPQIGQFLNMVNGKSSSQLKTMAENIARERGADINEIAKQLGFNLPK